MGKQEAKKRRLTRQRIVILDELRKMPEHPTAERLYQAVRKRLPAVSFGTVYRNLKVLHEDGQIAVLDQGPGAARFDPIVERHYHVRCRNCGRTENVELSGLAELEQRAQAITGYEVSEHWLDFRGLCPQCRGGSK